MTKEQVMLSSKRSESWLSEIFRLEDQLREYSEKVQYYEHIPGEKKPEIAAEENISELLKHYNSLISEVVMNHPVYKYWLRYVPGMDPVISGHLLGRIAWDKISSPNQILAYCDFIKSSTKTSNGFLHKKLMNSFQYAKKKQSPYLVYYYKTFARLDKFEPSLKDLNSKGSLLERRKTYSKCITETALLLDLYFIYNLIVYQRLTDNSINDIMVNRYDMLITNLNEIAAYKLDLEKYKIMINKAKIAADI